MRLDKVLAPDGGLLGKIPLTHFFDKVWVGEDRFFLLDRGVKFYDYKMNDREVGSL